MKTELLDLLAVRAGHYVYESGHHGDTWLEISRLFVRPARLRPFAEELARRLAAHGVQVVCGPGLEGALLAQLVAEAGGFELIFADRVPAAREGSLNRVNYRIPESLRDLARGKDVAVVDDVINAGSAVRAVLDDLAVCGATPRVLGALLVLGTGASDIARSGGFPLESLANREMTLWEPARCPLCAAGTPLSRGADHGFADSRTSSAAQVPRDGSAPT